MILTDIRRKIKESGDISNRTFAILAIILLLGGVYLAFLVISHKYSGRDNLKVVSRAFVGTAVTSDEGVGIIKGKYVASRSGDFYYLPNCSGAKRIKEKNMIWFDTKEDALAHGLKPAVNCDGL